MSAQLHDPLRVRALERASRRASRRARPWWKPAPRDRSSKGSVARAVRLLLTVLVGGAGILATKEPLALHLLSLYGLVILHVRVTRLRELLYADSALPALAQLPVPDASLFDYQLRRFGRGALPAALDAFVFWVVVIGARSPSMPWLLLLATAVAYAVATDALAFLLVQRARGLGVAWLVVVVALLATGRGERSPWLWDLAKPLLGAAAWLTPWGWLGTLVTQPAAQLWWSVLAIGLAVAALLALRWARARVRKVYVLQPAWRALAGRPQQTWLVEVQRQQEEAASSQGSEWVKAKPVKPEPPTEPPTIERIAGALATARAVQPGASVAALGWAGRRAQPRWSAFERTLADLLAPTGPSDAQWRWALLLAALPALAAVAGISLRWVLVALSMIFFWRRVPVAALLLLGLLGVTFSWPGLTELICLFGPCVIAVMSAMPLFGGTWEGLPMNATMLGSVPRSWAAMMRIKLRYIGLRLLASVPIAALVALALAFAIKRELGAGVAAMFTFFVISSPWIGCLKLLQRTRGELELSLGRVWLTLLSSVCLVLQLIAGATLIAGASIAVEALGRGTMLVGAGLVLSFATTALHLVLLRHAYRRCVDFVARA